MRCSCFLMWAGVLSLVVACDQQAPWMGPEDAKIVEGWPKTCDAAVDRILGALDKTSVADLKKVKQEDLIAYHHGWGTGIRNDFGLWGGNTELAVSCTKNSVLGIKSSLFRPPHPDDVSQEIINRVWLAVQSKVQVE